MTHLSDDFLARELTERLEALKSAHADALAALRAVRRQAVDAAGVQDARVMSHWLSVIRDTADAALKRAGDGGSGVRVVHNPNAAAGGR